MTKAKNKKRFLDEKLLDTLPSLIQSDTQRQALIKRGTACTHTGRHAGADEVFFLNYSLFFSRQFRLCHEDSEENVAHRTHLVSVGYVIMGLLFLFKMMDNTMTASFAS